MITEENYIRTREIVMKDFRESGALDDTPDLQRKVNSIVNAFEGIYTKLKGEDLIPNGMDFNIFQTVVIERLKLAVHQAQISQMFGH